MKQIGATYLIVTLAEAAVAYRSRKRARHLGIDVRHLWLEMSRNIDTRVPLRKGLPDRRIGYIFENDGCARHILGGR